MNRYKTMTATELGPRFAIVNVFGQDWNIVSIQIEHHSDPFYQWDHGKPSNYEIEMRGPQGAEMTLNVPPTFTFEVKVPEPWEGLKPGDFLAGSEQSKRHRLFIYLGQPKGGQEPYLMHVDNWMSTEGPNSKGNGYSTWSWYEQEYGPLKKLEEWGGLKTVQVGLNYYRTILGMKEIKE